MLGIDRKSSLRLPMNNPMTKGWLTKKRVKYEILSLLNYATEENTIFHGLDVFEHDSNITLTLLYRYICSLDSIPNKLILHMDNCFKENKNMFVFAFCVLLVEKDIFQQVEMHFLPPGHTHDSNDACFVPVAKGEKKFNCFTPEDFDEFAKQCFKNYDRKPNLQLIQNIYDWKAWLQPYIRDLSGHSKARSFLFKKNQNEGVMFCKESALHPDWIGYEGSTQNGFQFLIDRPGGFPSKLIPKPIPKQFLQNNILFF